VESLEVGTARREEGDPNLNPATHLERIEKLITMY
jgi:hypothetical protein